MSFKVAVYTNHASTRFSSLKCPPMQTSMRHSLPSNNVATVVDLSLIMGMWDNQNIMGQGVAINDKTGVSQVLGSSCTGCPPKSTPMNVDELGQEARDSFETSCNVSYESYFALLFF